MNIEYEFSKQNMDKLTLNEKLNYIFSNFNVVLGSSSSSRRNVLNRMGISEFFWFSPSIDEALHETQYPETCSINIAMAKMNACLSSFRSQRDKFYMNIPVHSSKIKGQYGTNFNSLFYNEDKNTSYKLGDKNVSEKEGPCNSKYEEAYRESTPNMTSSNRDKIDFSPMNNQVLGPMQQIPDMILDPRSLNLSHSVLNHQAKSDDQILAHTKKIYNDINYINRNYTNQLSILPFTEFFLICSDQVVFYNQQIRQKPKDIIEARKYLSDYSQYDLPISTYSAIALASTSGGKSVNGVEVSHVWFSEIKPDDIEKILNSGKTMHSAGGFLIDDEIMGQYISKIEGSEDAIMGLPTNLLAELFDKFACHEGGWDSASLKSLRKSSLTG